MIFDCARIFFFFLFFFSCIDKFIPSRSRFIRVGYLAFEMKFFNEQRHLGHARSLRAPSRIFRQVVLAKIGKEMDGNLYLDADFLEKKAAILKLYCTFLMNTRGCSILCNHFHNVWWSHRGYIYKSFVYYLFPNAIEYIGIILFKNMLFVYINHCWNFYFLEKWNFSKEICLFKVLKHTLLGQQINILLKCFFKLVLLFSGKSGFFFSFILHSWVHTFLVDDWRSCNWMQNLRDHFWIYN